MFAYIIRRLLLMFPTLLGITALVFFTMAFSPGGIGGPLLDRSGNMRGGQQQYIRAQQTEGRAVRPLAQSDFPRRIPTQR
jgi:ABC-type microcin C transport system permease subunit YejB